MNSYLFTPSGQFGNTTFTVLREPRDSGGAHILEGLPKRRVHKGREPHADELGFSFQLALFMLYMKLQELAGHICIRIAHGSKIYTRRSRVVSQNPNFPPNTKLTQGELGRRLKTSAMAVFRWERGDSEPSPDAYICLGNIAGDPLCWFFGERAGLSAADVMRVLPAASRRLR
jgi:hypothetical protein